jgi:hypothetical protein
MVSIPLRVFIHGLIALIPTTDPGGTKMTALLVDGRMTGTTECAMEHHPRLRFFIGLDQSSKCAQAGCQLNGASECICEYDANATFPRVPDPLVGKKVSLEILPTPVLATMNPSSVLPDRSLPEDSREAAKFSYVANLSREPFNLSVQDKYLPAQGSFDGIVTRVEIPYKDITACSLAARLDGGQANVHAMSFRPMEVASDSGDIGYALAQMVVTELTVPDGGTGTQKVILHIGDQSGGDIPIQLMPGKDPKGQDQFEIDLSNSLSPSTGVTDAHGDLAVDNPCDDGVARHFKHFFPLTKESPAVDQQLIPHVRLTQFKSWAPLEPSVCKRRTFAISSRPICPMATFNP